MSFKKAPVWVQKKIAAMQTGTKKLFLFPEGKTKVVIDMESEPETRDLGNGNRTIYTAEINGQPEKFSPSKTLEKLILTQLMEGHNILNVCRTGLEIKNTKYMVEVVK